MPELDLEHSDEPLDFDDAVDSWDEGLEAKVRAEWRELMSGQLMAEASAFAREGEQGDAGQMSAEPAH